MQPSQSLHLGQIPMSVQERREVVGIGGRCGHQARDGERESDGPMPHPLPRVDE
jgi:hypothetical protein